MQILLVKPEDFSPKRTIVACAIEHDGEILMLQRSEHESQPKTWCLPSGKMEEGEHPYESICREIEEETWIVVQCELHHDGEYFVRSPWGDSILHFFHHQCDVKHNIVLSEREHKGYQWMKPKDALKLELIKWLDFNLRKLFGL